MPIYRENIGRKELGLVQPNVNLLFNSTFLGADTVTTLQGKAPKVAVGSFIGGTGSIPNELRLSGTTWAILDKFIYNNTDNGGTAGLLGADIKTLLSAMGDSSRRFGTEFAILRLTCTGGVGWPAFFNVHSYYTQNTITTLSYWMRVVTPALGDFAQNSEMIDARTGTRFDDGAWHYRKRYANSWAMIDNYGIGVPYTIDIALPYISFSSREADDYKEPHIHPVLHLLEDNYK